MNLVGLVYDHLGKSIPRRDIGKTVREILSDAQLETDWFVDLDRHRNFFIHEGTSYVAVDLSNEKKDIYDLLIMKENLHEFTDPHTFIRLSDLNKILHGFLPAMSTIEKHLASLYS